VGGTEINRQSSTVGMRVMVDARRLKKSHFCDRSVDSRASRLSMQWTTGSSKNGS